MNIENEKVKLGFSSDFKRWNNTWFHIEKIWNFGLAYKTKYYYQIHLQIMIFLGVNDGLVDYSRWLHLHLDQYTMTYFELIGTWPGFRKKLKIWSGLSYMVSKSILESWFVKLSKVGTRRQVTLSIINRRT